jgi:dCMP deaminase
MEHNIPSGTMYEQCRSVHAEMNAIISAGRKLCIGADLYLYGYDIKDQTSIVAVPCMMCRRFIVQAGIKRVITLNDFGDGLVITEVKPQEIVDL